MSGTSTGTPISDLTVLPTRTVNTLAMAMLKTAECLKGLRYGTSTTAGSQTTLVDANMIEPADFFNGGTIWFLSGVLAGESAKIGDFDSATGTFTFETKTNAPGIGVSYAVMDAMYTREALKAAVNSALSELGPFPQIYDFVLDDDGETLISEFTTVANQESYTLPAGVFNIKKVFVATSAVDPYGWSENMGWFEDNGSLWFDNPIPSTSDMPMRLFYEKPHDWVWDDTDTITASVHPDLLAWSAALRAVVTRIGVAENSEPNTKEILPFIQGRAAVMNKYPVRHFRKASRPSGW